MDNKKSCIIIGAAPCNTLAFLSEELLKNAFVIAADGGYETAKRLGISVDAFVGDCDSSGLKPDCDDVTYLPREKDFGDVHTAVCKALSLDCNDFYLVGCSGGRADHYLANIALLEMINENGAGAVLCDEHNEIYFLSDGKKEFAKRKKYISVLALDEKIKGVTLRGLKYPLENAEISRACPIGISNEWTEDVCEIDVLSGRALIIISEDERK